MSYLHPDWEPILPDHVIYPIQLADDLRPRSASTPLPELRLTTVTVAECLSVASS